MPKKSVFISAGGCPHHRTQMKTVPFPISGNKESRFKTTTTCAECGDVLNVAVTAKPPSKKS